MRTQVEIDQTVKEMNDKMVKQWKENGLWDKLSRNHNQANKQVIESASELESKPKTRFVTAPPESNPIFKFVDITKEATSERYNNPMPQFKKINERYNAEESRY
jgi:hypothetical protein